MPLQTMGAHSWISPPPKKKKKKMNELTLPEKV